MTRGKIIGIAILVLLIAGGVFAYVRYAPDPSGTVSNIEDAAVRQAVLDFGVQMRMVSLLAPEAERKAAMEESYARYVAPELLERWAAGSEGALGRSTSSPWPQQIEIVGVREEGENYVVEGNVIEVTNASGGNTTIAAVYPVTLTLQMRDGDWLIVKSGKGAYSELPKSQTITGTWECLPHKDTTGPQTMECAFGIAVDGTHYAVNTELMAMYPVDFSTGTEVRITGIVTPVEQLSSIQKYDIKGIIRATVIEKI